MGTTNDFERMKAKLRELQKSEVDNTCEKTKAWLQPEPTDLEKKMIGVREHLLSKSYRSIL